MFETEHAMKNRSRKPDAVGTWLRPSPLEYTVHRCWPDNESAASKPRVMCADSTCDISRLSVVVFICQAHLKGRAIPHNGQPSAGQMLQDPQQQLHILLWTDPANVQQQRLLRLAAAAAAITTRAGTAAAAVIAAATGAAAAAAAGGWWRTASQPCTHAG